MAPKPKPKPKPKPSKPPPHPTPTPTRQAPEEVPHDQEPPCEFTHPCTTSTPSTSANANANASSIPSGKRKLISHIFGRNKTSTKLFPSHVWVHYCRKHYQRARYRARAWPFTQCDLLLDSLDRMEAWGGVGGFEVVLRRREVHRLASSEKVSGKGQGQGQGGEGVAMRKGRRGGSSASTSTSASVSASRDGDDDHNDEEYADQEEGESSDDGDGDGTRKRRRRRPRIKTCPVPEWLRAETGRGKSFDEIRDIVKRIREDLTEQHRKIQTQKTKSKGKKEQVLFPDIEILPTFRPWVLEQAGRDAEDREGRGKMSRVSRKGAVQKVQR